MARKYGSVEEIMEADIRYRKRLNWISEWSILPAVAASVAIFAAIMFQSPWVFGLAFVVLVLVSGFNILLHRYCQKFETTIRRLPTTKERS